MQTMFGILEVDNIDQTKHINNLNNPRPFMDSKSLCSFIKEVLILEDIILLKCYCNLYNYLNWTYLSLTECMSSNVIYSIKPYHVIYHILLKLCSILSVLGSCLAFVLFQME